MQNKTSRNIIGPDINEYRGDVNYTLLATQTPYAYLRGSGFGTGRFRIDRKFIEYANGLRNVGVKTGAYHYAVPSTDLTTADAQCDGFIDILQQAYGPGRYGDLFPVIDIEAPLDKSISTDALLDWVDRFRKRFERRTRRKMMLYTGAFFIELYNNFYHTKKGFILADMPLWIAMYPEIQPNPPYPRDQGGWTRWRMWQFTENGTMPGVNPPVDLNYGPENLDLLMQPRKVRNFRAVATGQEIRLTWTPNTDIDLGGYNIFINSNYVTTLGRDANSYVLKLANKPSVGEKYIMSIEAFDTDGDFSQERASANVTFGRNTVFNIENTGERQWNNRWDREADVKSLEFNDPVDSLAKRFIKPIERKENINIYDDFVETDDEFDDILYMKRLEAETAYKKYYGNREPQDKLSLYEVNNDYRCEDDCEYLEEKSKYTCPKCNKCHEEHHKHHDDDHDHHEEHHEHHDDDHDHHEEHHDHNDDHHEHHDDHDKWDKYDCHWKKEYRNDHDNHKDDDYNENHNFHEKEYKQFCYDNDDHHEHHDEHDKWDKDDFHWKKEYCNYRDNHKDDDYYENHNFHEKEYKQFFYDNDELHENHEDKSEFIKEWDKKTIKCKCDREEENQDLVLNDDYKRYEKPAYDEILREEYEGDRRRLENRDSMKYKVCEECVQPKSNCMKCEYLLQDMYLNNCDYGHKHHKKKHYDYKECNDCYQSKKKKKKHHKKHHR
ncbi:glycoside hydrolase family 25 protein [Clostridium sp.]|uniref:glycoside hydrolase family 25 protein n=1 Tax=Clostridium sp. TaxID=1506 RepID=UPI00321626A7